MAHRIEIPTYSILHMNHTDIQGDKTNLYEVIQTLLDIIYEDLNGIREDLEAIESLRNRGMKRSPAQTDLPAFFKQQID